MKLLSAFAAAMLSLTLAVPAFAAADPAQYVLTQSVYSKIKAMEPELKKLEKNEKDDDDGEDLDTVEDIVKMIDSKPAAKALLARHGLSSKEYALAMLAMVHAGFAVAAESMMDQKAIAKAMAGYTKAQQQNIVFMRPLVNKK